MSYHAYFLLVCVHSNGISAGAFPVRDAGQDELQSRSCVRKRKATESVRKAVLLYLLYLVVATAGADRRVMRVETAMK